MTARPAGDRGIVLVVVLWTLALLTLLASTIAGTGRREAELGAALRAAAGARAAADAALHETLYDLLTGRLGADGVARRRPVGTAVATVTVTNEDGKLNPNTAPAELLSALFRAAGADPAGARTLTTALLAWRGGSGSTGADPLALAAYRAAGRMFGPPGESLRSIQELRLVLGMTPALYAAVAPHMSIHAEGVLDARIASPMVRKALELTGIDAAAPAGVQASGPATVLITVQVQAAQGAADLARPAVVLTWDESADGT
jgi:general secretion pathway protein K